MRDSKVDLDVGKLNNEMAEQDMSVTKIIRLMGWDSMTFYWIINQSDSNQPISRSMVQAIASALGIDSTAIVNNAYDS